MTEAHSTKDEVHDLRRQVAWLVQVVSFFQFLLVLLSCLILLSWVWWANPGGAMSAVPISIILVLACHPRDPSKIASTVMWNLRRIMRSDRLLVLLFCFWLALVVGGPLVWDTSSGGTPPTLVLFSIAFILVYMPAEGVWLARNPGRLTTCSCRRIGVWAAALALCMVVLVLWLDVPLTRAVAGLMRSTQCAENMVEDTASTITKPLEPCASLNPLAAVGTPEGPTPECSSLDIILSWALAGVSRRTRVFLQQVAATTSTVGEVPLSLPTTMVLLVVSQLGVPAARGPIRVVFFLIVKAAVVTGAASAGLKMLVHRHRPVIAGDPMVWTGPSTHTYDARGFSKLDLSFPCGHAAVTFACATVVANLAWRYVVWNRPALVQFGLARLLLRTAVFAIVSFTAVSRIADCVHWPSDVVFGSVFGIACGTLLIWGQDQQAGGDCVVAAAQPDLGAPSSLPLPSPRPHEAAPQQEESPEPSETPRSRARSVGRRYRSKQP